MPAGRSPRSFSLKGPARLLAGAGMGLAVALLLWLGRGTRMVEKLELALLDVRIRHAAGCQAPAKDIVLMQVHDADIEAVQRDLNKPWPWDLDVNAAIMGVLKDAGARGVLIDVYHFDRGTGADDVPERVQRLETDPEKTEIEAAMAEDYAAALKSVGGGRVALAYELVGEASYVSPSRVEAGEKKLSAEGLVAPPGAPRQKAVNYPVRRVIEGAARLGFANVELDADGAVRRSAPLAHLGNRAVMSLPLAFAWALGEAQVKDGELLVGGRPVPLADDGTFLIDYRSGTRLAAYPRVAPTTALKWATQRDAKGALPPEAKAALEGKLVVWGVNAAGRTDLVATPIAASHDGPEVQATVLDNLLHGGMRVRAPSGTSLLFTALAAALVGLVSMAPRGKALPHVFALLVLALTVLVAFLVFDAGTALDLFTPLLAGVIAWLLVTSVKLLTEGRYNRWLEGAFSRYLAPSVIEALKGDPSLLQLGGKKREVTVLFSDVAGFTTLCEKLESAQVTELLNEYLTRHCDAVFAHEGVVDKFIGDAVMAFWGDPVPQPDHALRACRTALDVQAAMPGLEPVWRGMGLPEFKVRVGLNAGTANLGNMGSRQRFDYTALGDTVNLASRLEGANKAFGTSILIGQEVRAQAGAAILVKPLARLVVVGKDEPVQVYELVALAERATDVQRRHVEAFTRAIEAARAGRLPAARTALEEARALAPEDGACAWFSKLLARLEAGAEPSPWSGIYALSSK